MATQRLQRTQGLAPGQAGGDVIEISGDDFTKYGQNLSDVLGYVPVAGNVPVTNTGFNITEALRLGSLGGGGVNGGGTGSSSSSSSSSSTTTDFEKAYGQAGEKLKDWETPMSIDDIRAQEAERKKRLAEEAAAIFDPKIGRAKEIGEKQVGSAKGQLGVSRGLGFSTAEASYLSSVQKEVDDRVSEIEKQKTEYISSGNFKAAEMADAALQKLTESKNNLLLKKLELTFDLMNAAREERSASQSDATMDLNIAKFLQDLPSGKTIEIGGKTYQGLGSEDVESTFKGSDFVNIMKSLKEGEEKTITDPLTGKDYTIVGIASDDPKLKQFTSVDNKGNFNIINYDTQTGKVVNQTKVTGVGKTGSSTPSTTIIMNEKKASALEEANKALRDTMGTDNYWNTAVYESERTKAAQKGISSSDFDKQFSQRLNPGDPVAKRFLTASQIDVASGGGWTQEQKQTALDSGISQASIDMAEAAGLSLEELIK